MATEGLITFDELRNKPETLRKDYARAKAELDAALRSKEKIVALEADAKNSSAPTLRPYPSGSEAWARRSAIESTNC